MLTRKEQILQAFRAFIAQRSGMDWRDYGDAASYRSEQRRVTKDRHAAETLLSAVAWRDSITAEKIEEAARHAFSGRCSLVWSDKGVAVDYCTGQYFPTEYRRAVAAVMASALWDYFRDNMPAPVYKHHGDADHLPMQTTALYDGLSAGDWLRRKARQEFGRGLQQRYFN